LSKDKEITFKIGKPLSVLIKVLVILIAFWYIYKEVFLKENISDIIFTYKGIINNTETFWLLLFSIILMFFNWGLEAYKWKMMISKIEQISFLKSYKAILTGITVSFFTPNRIGEFGGRVFHLDKANKIKAVLITLLGNMSQLITTIIIGLMSLMFFLRDVLKDNLYLYYAVLTSVIVLIAVIITVYFNARFLTYLLNKVKLFTNYHEYTKVFSYYNFRELFVILLLSLCRYVIFTFQFYLLLKVLSVNIALIPALSMIFIVFLVMAAIPTIALSEIGVRGSVAMYFLGILSANTFGILTASFSLWIINLVIPAIIGSVFVFSLKLSRN
jgi:uncharacterized membrane protein YbhN (UPF0104 family)